MGHSLSVRSRPWETARDGMNLRERESMLKLSSFYQAAWTLRLILSWDRSGVRCETHPHRSYQLSRVLSLQAAAVGLPMEDQNHPYVPPPSSSSRIRSRVALGRKSKSLPSPVITFRSQYHQMTTSPITRTRYSEGKEAKRHHEGSGRGCWWIRHDTCKNLCRSCK